MALLDLWNMTDGAKTLTLNQTLEEHYRLTAVPKFNAMRCAGGKREQDRCTLCARVCPKGIYPTEKHQYPNWTGCMQCGMCAAACPEKCIAFPLERAAEYLKEVGRDGSLQVSCRRQEGSGGLKVHCLAALSWEQLALAALNGGVTLFVGSCADCPEAVLKEQTAARLEQLRFFLGDAVFSEKVMIRNGQDRKSQDPETGFSRRELFTSFLEMREDRAFAALPELQNKQDNGLLVRAMLRDRVRALGAGAQPGEKPKYRVRLPVFSQDCYNCGTCEWKCPQKALKLQNEGGSILATVDVWRCTGCGVCRDVCKIGAITDISAMRVTGLGRTALKRIPAFLCADCGKPRPKEAPEGVCAHCLGQRKARRVREQRERERQEKKEQQEQL